MELEPRRRAHHGEVAGRGEERRAPRVLGGVKLQGLVYWVRKEQTKLWQAMLRLEMHHGDGKSSTKLWWWRREKQSKETGTNGDGLG